MGAPLPAHLAAGRSAPGHSKPRLSEERRSPAKGGGSDRAPGSAGAQAAAGQLVACSGDCKALVLACPGLVPFVVEALRVLAERCACLPAHSGLGRPSGRVLGCATASVVSDSSACAAYLHLLQASTCR